MATISRVGGAGCSSARGRACASGAAGVVAAGCIGWFTSQYSVLVIQNFLYVGLGDPGKPLEEFCHSCPIAQVLEERCHRNARATKAPGATQDLWRPLDRVQVFK